MAASLHSPIRSPSRRVLGDKSTNMTLIVTPKSKRTMDASDSIDVIKSNLLQEGIEVSKKHILTPTASVGKLAGQKRGIDMVEDAEREERQSQRENIHKEEQEGNDGRKEVVGAATGPRRFTTIPSFHASQEGPMEIEEQFNIQDEMSQGAVDNLVSSATFPLHNDCIRRFLSVAVRVWRLAVTDALLPLGKANQSHDILHTITYSACVHSRMPRRFHKVSRGFRPSLRNSPRIAKVYRA